MCVVDAILCQVFVQCSCVSCHCGLKHFKLRNTYSLEFSLNKILIRCLLIVTVVVKFWYWFNPTQY